MNPRPACQWGVWDRELPWAGEGLKLPATTGSRLLAKPNSDDVLLAVQRHQDRSPRQYQLFLPSLQLPSVEHVRLPPPQSGVLHESLKRRPQNELTLAHLAK
jgi:hypothetical protein